MRTYLQQTAGWLGRLGRALQSAVFPHRCLGCDAFFTPALKQDQMVALEEAGDETEMFMSLVQPYLCEPCLHSITLVKSPLCRICGMPFESRSGEDHTCGACIKSPRQFDMARACGRYDQGLKELIHWFKYRHVPQLAQPLGTLLAWGFETHFGARHIDWIVPVPLHSRRMRRRGFNQAYLLARAARSAHPIAAERQLQLPAIATDTLVRVKATMPQTGLKKEDRRRNIRNAFAVQRPEKIRGKSLLLVDDVYTTGATVNECAKMLKKYGVNWVGVLSLARADR